MADVLTPFRRWVRERHRMQRILFFHARFGARSKVRDHPSLITTRLCPKSDVPFPGLAEAPLSRYEGLPPSWLGCIELAKFVVQMLHAPGNVEEKKKKKAAAVGGNMSKS